MCGVYFTCRTGSSCSRAEVGFLGEESVGNTYILVVWFCLKDGTNSSMSGLHVDTPVFCCVVAAGRACLGSFASDTFQSKSGDLNQEVETTDFL